MLKIGITGNIACGKSTAYEIIKSEGYPIIDCDDIVKKLYSDIDFISEIAKNFPTVVINGKTNLKRLSENIFTDKIFKKEFENFIFPKVKKIITQFFEGNSNEHIVFVIAPLLFEAKFENLFDKIIFISSEENIRKERLIARKSVLSDLAENVIKSQIKEEEKIPKCDYVITNNGTIDEFNNAVKKLISDIS